jgi:hypothetical protein
MGHKYGDGSQFTIGIPALKSNNSHTKRRIPIINYAEIGRKYLMFSCYELPSNGSSVMCLLAISDTYSLAP